MKYRAEIDGLRSFAILPVLVYHVGYSGLSGGFAGVDVFFVISGFLITSIIRADLEKGRFSIMEFYKRRILRIVPALIATLSVSFVMAYYIMLPSQLETFGGSVVAATLFFSNIFFWQHSGYFTADADFFPLLHTWSLAVEEQFYLFFPLVMMIVARFMRSWYTAVILLIIACSFALSVVMTGPKPSASFYLLPTRAWELGLGALLATVTIPGVLNRFKEILAAIGLGLICFSMVYLTTDMPFPSYNAAYPVIGATLVIGFAQGTFIGRFLSLPPLVWIGKISYSLYLVHWPLIVFYRLQYDALPGRQGMFELMVMSFALAIFSYYFVELPFRDRRLRVAPTPRILFTGVAALTAVAAIGGGAQLNGKRWQDLPTDVTRIASFLDYTSLNEYQEQFRSGRCMIEASDGDFDVFDEDYCLSTVTDRPNYIVLGDSHAGHIWRAIHDAYPDVNVMQATASGCRPLLNAKGRARCTDMMKFVFNDFILNEDIDGIILAARWEEQDVDKLRQTTDYLSDHVDDVIVFGPTVEYEGELPILLAKSRLSGNEELLISALDPSRKSLSDRMAKAMKSTGVSFYPVYDYICNGWRCLAETEDGEPMQFDYGHFTLAGSMELVKLMKADRTNPLRLP